MKRPSLTILERLRNPAVSSVNSRKGHSRLPCSLITAWFPWTAKPFSAMMFSFSKPMAELRHQILYQQNWSRRTR